VRAQPNRERTEARAIGGLAAAAIKPWAIQLQPAKRCSAADSVRAIAAKRRLALRTGGALNQEFSRLRLDHLALKSTRHGLGFLETQTYQFVGAPFNRRDFDGSSRPGGVSSMTSRTRIFI